MWEYAEVMICSRSSSAWTYKRQAESARVDASLGWICGKTT